MIHAAAYKHVSFLETQLLAAVANNALVTFRLLECARRGGVAKLLLVSTDKAVMPHSVMGASKRLAERLTVSLQRSAVRLGNVLGSTGSVLPLWTEQFARGLKLTVTDAAAVRYFFSSDEAVEIILKAVFAGQAGEIVIPRHCSPLRVVDLATSRFPDATIEFIGLRPGEKLTEELIGPDEKRIRHAAETLDAVSTAPLNESELAQTMSSLSQLVAERDRAGVFRLLCDLVPQYIPSDMARQHAMGNR